MNPMQLTRLDDIDCYEVGSGESAPWTGRRASLREDLPALTALANQGLIDLKIDRDSVSIGGLSRVGLVVLPSGRRLTIRSKISGLRILEWLAYLGEFRPLQHWLPERGIAAQKTDRDDWHRCIARLFLFALEDVTRWHKRKDYAAEWIEEPEIRGRINATKLARQMNLLPRVPQVKRRRTLDVPFNMILAKALDRIPILLGNEKNDDRKRLARLREQWLPISRDIDDPILAVTSAQWAAPPGYRAALQLARLILIGTVIDPQSKIGGQAFTLSLAAVWERALKRMCAELVETGWRQVSDAEHTRRWDDPAGKGDSKRWLVADVILENSQTRWVLDAKYKREFGNESRSDRFQMCAYAVGFNASEVSLVYPMATHEGPSRRIILNTSFGGQDVRISSIWLPMSEGPEACIERLQDLSIELHDPISH